MTTYYVEIVENYSTHVQANSEKEAEELALQRIVDEGDGDYITHVVQEIRKVKK